MKNKIGEIIKLFKELRKTPRGRAILFFAFYLVFFIVLSIGFRLSPHNVSNNTSEEVDLNTILVEKYNGDNYAYKYVFNIDEVLAFVDGKKSGYREAFSYTILDSTKNYYKDMVSYYENDLVVESPNELLTITSNIDNLIKEASYDSITNYQSGKEVYRYLISSSNISLLVDKKDLDVSEVPNEIMVTLDDEKVTDISLNLDSYCVATSKCNSKMRINIKYSEIGEIKEIVNSNN